MNAVGSALYSRLSTASALTTALGGTYVYNTIAPQDTSLVKYVVFSKMSGTDENLSPRRAKDLIYFVKAVVVDDLETAGELDGLIDTQLHAKPLTITGYGNYWIMRESDICYAEPGVGGIVYWHCGGQYRIRIAE